MMFFVNKFGKVDWLIGHLTKLGSATAYGLAENRVNKTDTILEWLIKHEIWEIKGVVQPPDFSLKFT